MKEHIAKAFVELVTESKTYKISVETICKKANISKTTFYKYFTDKYAVIEYIFDKEIIMPFKDAMYKISEDGKLHIKDSTLDVITLIYGKKEFYKVLIKENGQNSLEDFLLKSLTVRSIEYLSTFAKKSMDDVDREYFAYCYAVFFVGLLKKWLEDERNIAPEKLTKYFFFEYGQ